MPVAATANTGHPRKRLGTDRTAAEGSTVTISGTAADPDGDDLAYLWTSDRPGLPISGGDTLSASFTAPQVDSDTTITFTLTADDGRGASSTDTVSVTILAGSPPAAPQSLRSGSVTNTTITLTWDDPGDATITGYKILSRTPYPQTELTVLVDDTGSADTSYVVRNLEPDTTYVFRVVALNEHGESGWSGFIRLSTLP